jgi:hypothetical protein
MSFFGSRVSSAASDTPSTARKNQIANGNAAQMPCQPKGRNSEAPAFAVSGLMLGQVRGAELGDHRDHEHEQRDDRDRR